MRQCRMRYRVLIFLLFCVEGLYSQQLHRAEEQGLVGPVFAVISYRIDYQRKFGEMVEGTPIKDTIAAYGPDGIARFSSSLYDGHLTTYYRYYVVDQRLIRTEYWSYGDIFSITLLSYDTYGRLVSEDEFSRDTSSLQKRTIYKYDDDGRLVDQTAYGPDGGLWKLEYDVGFDFPSKNVFVYDVSGRKTEERSYRYDGELISRVTYVFDENMEAQRYFDSDGTLQYTQSIQTDSNGNIVLSTVQSVDGTSDSKTTYMYDDFGDLVVAETSDAAGNVLHRVTYEYDEYGNWTSMKVESREEYFGTTEFAPSSRVIREIVYRPN